MQNLDPCLLLISGRVRRGPKPTAAITLTSGVNVLNYAFGRSGKACSNIMEYPR